MVPGLAGLGHLSAQHPSARGLLDRVLYALGTLVTLRFVVLFAANLGR